MRSGAIRALRIKSGWQTGDPETVLIKALEG
jgi:hypothetical protein